MKIAIFTDTYVPEVNGVAKTLKRYTDYLTEQKIEYKIFAPQNKRKVDFIMQSSHVHHVKSFPFFLYPDCRIALPNIIHVRKETEEFNPDIIHVTTPFNMGLSGLHIAKKLKIPIVGSYHTNFDKYLDYYQINLLPDVFWKYMRWFHEPLRRIFVPSTDTLEQLQQKGFSNLSIWSRGIDTNVFHPNYDKDVIREKHKIKETYILTFVGRIAKEKDVFLLPEIATKLPSTVKNDIHWLIVGDGPLKSELEEAAPTNMTFTGFVEGTELANIYAASDLFVFPSSTETFGNVVLESLACGTPVIGANAGGVKSIVNNGINGILCEEKDVTDFVQAIVSLLGRDRVRHVMSENGIRFAQAQSWDKIFRNLLSEYEDVLEDMHAAKEETIRELA